MAQEGLHVHGQGGRDRFIHLSGGRVSLLVHWLFHDGVSLRYISGAPAAALGDAQQVAVLGDGPPCDDVTEAEEQRGELLVGERGAAVLLPDDVPEDREDLLAAALAPVRPGGRLVEEGGGLQGGVGGIEGEPARTCDVGHVAGGPGDLAHVYAGGGLDVLEGHGPRAAEVTRAEEVDLVGGACLQDTAEGALRDGPVEQVEEDEHGALRQRRPREEGHLGAEGLVGVGLAPRGCAMAAGGPQYGADVEGVAVHDGKGPSRGRVERRLGRGLLPEEVLEEGAEADDGVRVEADGRHGTAVAERHAEGPSPAAAEGDPSLSVMPRDRPLRPLRVTSAPGEVPSVKRKVMSFFMGLVFLFFMVSGRIGSIKDTGAGRFPFP